MSLPRISVIVPTVPGREERFEQTCAAYHDQAAGNYDLELLVEYGHPAVGCAWQAGAEKASGDYIHLTGDDTSPRPGWHAAAVEAVACGFVPHPQVYGVNGEPESLPAWGVVGEDWAPVSTTTIPFMSRAQWEKIRPLYLGHYYADDWVGYRARKSGFQPVLRTGYAFDHSWHQVLRGTPGMTEGSRLAYDRPLFEEAKAMDARGEWTAPWPPRGRDPREAARQ